MNKLDTFACDQIDVDVVKPWPPVPVLGPGTISYYAADARQQRAQVFAQVFKDFFKHLFTEPSADHVRNVVDDSPWLGSDKSIHMGRPRA